MAAVAHGIREGVSQRDLMLEIEFQGRRRGASHVSFNPWACLEVVTKPPRRGDERAMLRHAPRR